MDLKQLQAIGGLVSSSLVKKEITYTRPRTPEEGEGDPVTETATIHVRKRNGADFLRMHRAGEDDRAFVALHRCVCAEDGSPLFESPEVASQLAEWLLGPMLLAVNEVNDFAPKRQPPKTTSGRTSRSPSAGRSRK